jgi:hypothetical protein
VTSARTWHRITAGVALVALVLPLVLIRPLLHLDGADLVADRLLHVVVPVLAFVAGFCSGRVRASTGPPACEPPPGRSAGWS